MSDGRSIQPQGEHFPLPRGVWDGRHWRGDRRERVDVLVIGSGCGGATAAAALAEAGLDVLLIEQGAYRDSRQFSGREVDMWSKLYAGRGMTGPEDASCAVLYGETVGGSSVHYMANSFRAPAWRLDEWVHDLGLEGLGPADLAPYYEVIEARHGVHRSTPAEINRNNEMFRRGCEALGWRSGPMPQARRDCANLGLCLLGCPLDRKQSQLLTHIPRALAAGARLFAQTRLRSLRLRSRRVVGASCELLGWDRRVRGRLEVEAHVVILAAGGVGSPAILLRQGLANSSGQVGENFFITPHFFTVGAFGERIEGWRGMPAGWYCDHWLRVNEGGEGGYMIQGIFAQPAMIGQMIPGFGAEHRALMRQIGRFGAVLSLIDDEEPGRIGLRPDGRPRISYRLRGRDVAKARDFLEKSARLWLAAGADYALIPDVHRTRIRSERDLYQIGKISLDPGFLHFVGTSNLGTCRMGADPRTSVVDRRGACHDLDGLYIVDASVLPTGPAVDPSLTIMANSLRIACELAEELGVRVPIESPATAGPAAGETQ